MKSAFHFVASQLGEGNYQLNAEAAVLTAFLSDPKASLRAVVFGGDLLLRLAASTGGPTPLGAIRNFSPKGFERISKGWLHPNKSVLVRFKDPARVLRHWDELCVVCLDSIEPPKAASIDAALGLQPAYVGYMQVDDELGIHRYLYRNALIPRFCIMGRRVRSLEDPSISFDLPCEFFM
jgi:hypothetical protein